MFQLRETLESAWTPEIGGFFDKMKLLVRADLPAARRKRGTQYMKLSQNDSGQPYVDSVKFMHDYDDIVLDLILDWENVIDDELNPVPFSKEAAKRLLNYRDEETGHEIDAGTQDDPQKKRPALLFEYVYRFAGDTRNFLKN